MNLVIWAAVSASAEDWAYFWPMWVAGPWGAVLLARTLVGPRGERPRDGRDEPDRRQLGT